MLKKRSKNPFLKPFPNISIKIGYLDGYLVFFRLYLVFARAGKYCPSVCACPITILFTFLRQLANNNTCQLCAKRTISWQVLLFASCRRAVCSPALRSKAGELVFRIARKRPFGPFSARCFAQQNSAFAMQKNCFAATVHSAQQNAANAKHSLLLRRNIAPRSGAETTFASQMGGLQAARRAGQRAQLNVFEERSDEKTFNHTTNYPRLEE